VRLRGKATGSRSPVLTGILSHAEVADLNNRLTAKQPWRSIAQDMDISQATISRYRYR
jgi:FixJ family two-component response regulator